MLRPMTLTEVASAIVMPSIFLSSSAIFDMPLNIGLFAIAPAEVANDAKRL